MIRIIKVVLSIFIFVLAIFFYKFSFGINWKEQISLPNISSNDPITYELNNATILFDKQEVKKELEKGILNYYETHIDLLTHLDTLKGNFKLNVNDLFSMKLDTLPVGLVKSRKYIDHISESDWSRDTTELSKDFNDRRYFFFTSMEIIAPTLLYNKKAILYNKKGERVYNIKLAHERFGFASYYSAFEFENGEFFLLKDLAFGL